jgi:glycerophosphoryl diester phosphodiesterase
VVTHHASRIAHHASSKTMTRDINSYRPALVGHRGAAGLVAENTIPSFRRAIEIGVEWVELDVRLTADGHAVLLHDERLDRTTSGSGSAAELTLEQVRAVEVRSHGGTTAGMTAGEALRIPTLAEALAAITPPTRCLVELKRDDARETELVQATLAAIHAAGIADRVRLISFQESLLAEALRQAPELPRGIISGRDLVFLFAAAERQRCVAIHPNASLLVGGLAERCARTDLALNTWTVNDAAAIRRAVEFRPDEITTDFPDLADATLTEIGCR